jgi:hypothetical protein
MSLLVERAVAMKRRRDAGHEHRIVAHVDLDCFYVQVERSLNPKLKGKAVGVVQCRCWFSTTSNPILVSAAI